jgi:hypothetical protein
VAKRNLPRFLGATASPATSIQFGGVRKLCLTRRKRDPLKAQQDADIAKVILQRQLEKKEKADRAAAKKRAVADQLSSISLVSSVAEIYKLNDAQVLEQVRVWNTRPHPKLGKTWRIRIGPIRKKECEARRLRLIDAIARESTAV